MTRLKIEALSRERERERVSVTLRHAYYDIISAENLFSAWREFLRGKRKRTDVAKFSVRLTHNILELHRELTEETYRHGPYHAFKINDPKPRDIHKAEVRDRLLHHAIYRILYPYFNRKFIADSYSCRLDKGTHRAMRRFREYTGKISRNHTRTAWVLKCDIRKFFASIDHAILLEILRNHLSDVRTVGLLKEIIESFHSIRQGVGLPLGNLTSQLLVNVYMNEFDQFAKRKMGAKFYLRYADDLIFLSEDRAWLESIVTQIKEFLKDKLRLDLHPDKVFIKTFASGVDFLGWIHFPNHNVFRTSTKKRMFKRIKARPVGSVVASYRGILSHGNAFKLRKKLEGLLFVDE